MTLQHLVLVRSGPSDLREGGWAITKTNRARETSKKEIMKKCDH